MNADFMGVRLDREGRGSSAKGTPTNRASSDRGFGKDHKQGAQDKNQDKGRHRPDVLRLFQLRRKQQASRTASTRHDGMIGYRARILHFRSRVIVGNGNTGEQHQPRHEDGYEPQDSHTSAADETAPAFRPRMANKRCQAKRGPGDVQKCIYVIHALAIRTTNGLYPLLVSINRRQPQNSGGVSQPSTVV